MPETRRSRDREFRAGAVQAVLAAGKPLAQIPGHTIKDPDVSEVALPNAVG